MINIFGPFRSAINSTRVVPGDRNEVAGGNFSSTGGAAAENPVRTNVGRAT